MGAKTLDVAEIQRLRVSGVSNRDVAEMFGVAESSISRVMKREGLAKAPPADEDPFWGCHFSSLPHSPVPGHYEQAKEQAQKVEAESRETD